MSAVESALEVLSRAATMVQEERPKTAAASGLHRKPSSAWRRERRRDPIQSEALDMTAASSATAARQQQQQQQHGSRPSVIVPPPVTSGGAVPQPAPGLHSPSSSHGSSSSSEGSASADLLAGTTTEDTAGTPTASATPSAATRGQPQQQQRPRQQQRTGVRSAGVASDPAIDEHFKRSLGLKEYAAVFDANDKAHASADKEPGLTVDDHFAKALGETWTRLQAAGSTHSKQSAQ